MAAEIFQLLGKIGVDGVEEAHDALDKTNDKAGKLGTAFSKVGKVAVGVGKTIAVGVGAAATAVGALVKASVDGYAEYEQLVGGVETLYGAGIASVEEYAQKHGIALDEAQARWESYQNRQQDVMDNAANAYITAGMSANEYMNTVNGFAASLTSSLGKYENYAANYADMIVTDMADNANKMGTSLESIQNAYSGFAKQNFTMLDNLKLGYGGTKEEMERLLRDAEKYAGYIEGSLSIDSFADVAEAIHIVQEEMRITGTTAEEAMKTIQGSTSATKAAWQNLVTGFADENQNLEELVGNFVDSAVVMIGNIAERVQEILPRLVVGLQMLLDSVLPHLTSMIETLLPGVISGAVTLLVGLVQALPTILQILIEQIPFILTEIGTALVEAFPALLETVKMLFSQIWDYIAVELLGTEQDFETTFTQVKAFFEDAWAVIQQIWASVGQPVFNLIQDCIGIVQGVFAEKMPQIKKFVSTCFEDIAYFWNNNLKPCFDAIGNFIQNVLAPIFKKVFEGYIKNTVDIVFKFISDIWNKTLKPVFTGITDFLTGVFTGNWKQAFEGIKNIVSGVFNGIKSTVSLITNQLKNILSTGLNAAKMVVSNVLGGIKEKFGSIFENAKTIVKNAIEKIKSFFNFSWSLPQIKMPHFSISGSFSLSPPSIPKVSVSWYKKAMDDAMVLSDPTIFGYSGESGNLLGGGEANGNEVVAGESYLLRMIGDVVESKTSAQNDKIIELLSALLNAIVDGNLELVQAMLAGQTIKIGEREFARMVREYA